MHCNIDVLGYENYEKVSRIYDQFRIQNLKSLEGTIRSSETCKKPITIVFWDISGFSNLIKMFIRSIVKCRTRVLRRVLQDCKMHNCTQ